MAKDSRDKEGRVGAASLMARLVAGGLIITIPMVSFLVAREGGADGAFLGLMLILAGFGGIGLFYLLCTCFGVCRLASSEIRNTSLITMLNQMSQAIVITDQEGFIRYMNASYRQLTGGKKCKIERLFSVDEGASRILAKMSQVLRQGVSAYDEVTLPRPLNSPCDGKAIYAIHASKSHAAGEAIFIWVVEDISQRRQRQEHQFADLTQAINHLDHAAAGFIAWDKSGKVTYLNATLANWIGVDLATSAPDLLTLPRLIGAQCAIELRQFLLKTSPSQSRASVFQLDLFHDTGKRLPAHFYLAPTMDGEDGMGRAVIILAAPSQTTPSHQEGMRLDEEALRFAHYFNNCPIALAVIDDRGHLQAHNPHFARLFALETERRATQDLKITDLTPPDDAPAIGRLLDLAKETGQATPFDTRIVSHHGSQDDIRYIRLFARALAAEPDCLIIAVVETSEQKVLERHVGTLEQHMEQGQKMQAVGQLAGGIAHDFNNVLTAIMMSCDLLLSNHRSSDPSHPDIMNIKNNANRAASLVGHLLAFSRRQTLRPELFDVSDMLSDIRLLITRLIGIHITLTIEHGRDLWPIKADRSELERAIINLAANARDAMSEGGVLTIRSANIHYHDLPSSVAQQLEEGDYVLIEVRDNGTGMPEAVREKIFEPFFTTKEVGRGTGLGLSMVYGMITQTGGYVHCDSQPGKGTVFSLYLPAHRSIAGENPRLPPLEQSAESLNLRDLSGSATVMVVEDEDGVRMGSVKALLSRGYKVLEAASGIEALDIIKAEGKGIDLIVSDVVMPEMDGPTLLGEVRALGLETKFIFVSGYAEEAFAKNLPQEAQFAFLPKPFSLKQLALKVKEMLEKKQEEML